MSQKVAELLSRLEKRLDRSAIVSADEAGPGYREDPDGKTGALPEFVLRPRKTGEVSDILRLCNEAGQRLVVQGGRTGLAGAARIQPGEAVLSLERMTAIETPDREAATIVAEAGAPLQMVQDAADTAGLLFGVDIGARGTATVGGNVATNAGGIRVLRYGMYRAQVLGLEAVLADGSILTSLKGLSKDNSGYDLNQLFIGSEGTLGIVTRACLRLHPKPATEVNAFCALASLDAAIALLALLRQKLGPLLSAYEVNFAPLYGAMIPGMDAPAPLPVGSPVYVLAEIQGSEPYRDGERFAAVLMQAVEDGVIDDVVVSQSPREFHALWAVREDANRFLFSIKAWSASMSASRWRGWALSCGKRKLRSRPLNATPTSTSSAISAMAICTIRSARWIRRRRMTSSIAASLRPAAASRPSMASASTRRNGCTSCAAMPRARPCAA